MENIEALFPLKGQITQDIIDNANLVSPTKCIGALTFKQALTDAGIEPLHIGWGTLSGHLKMNPDQEKPINISTEGRVNMIAVTEPMEVEFIIVPEYLWMTNEESRDALDVIHLRNRIKID